MDLIDVQMGSPDDMLPELNRALRALRGAMDVLQDEELEERLQTLMRRFLLAEILGSQTIVAIAGAQGAGKSTLLSGMYDLVGEAAGWLPVNEGRGERLPVLVMEEVGVTTPCGFVRQLGRKDDTTDDYGVIDQPVHQDAFWQACCGGSPAALLPVLKVPPRYFQQAGAAWLLLPGYETVDRGNRSWQELMRQGFIGSSFFVVVTDSTRLASAGQDQIIKDMHDGLLKDAQPVVVISKTEGKALHADQLRELRRTAAKLFGLDDSSLEHRIVCTGAAGNAAYKQVWLPALASLLQGMGASGNGHRGNQFKLLEQTLRSDLNTLLATIRRRSDDYLKAGAALDSGGAAVLKDCLEAFDEAAGDLRGDFNAAVKNLLNKHVAEARGKLDKALVDKHEGVGNKCKNVFNTVTEDQRMLEHSVEQAWSEPGPLLAGFADGLLEVTATRLHGPARKALPSVVSYCSVASPGETVWQRLGYVDGQGAPVPWAEPSEAKLQDLRRILGGDDSPTSPELREAIKLLPTMTLEYVRSASQLLPAAGLLPEALTKMPAADVQASLGRVKDGMENGSIHVKGILTAVTALFAGDIAGDGTLNFFGALGAAAPLSGAATTAGAASTGAAGAAAATGTAATGTAAAGAAVSVMAAAVAILALGYLAHLGIQETRRHDHEVRSHAHAMLLGIKDAHHAHFISQFDALMNRMREYLRVRLRSRYALDERLMLQDRLAKALADVGTARRSLLDCLGHQGVGLEPFKVREG